LIHFYKLKVFPHEIQIDKAPYHVSGLEGNDCLILAKVTLDPSGFR
jgi:hypothetical protein